MPVQAVDKSLDGGLVEMTQVGCRLAGLLAVDQGLWVDEAEGINDNLALDGLDGVDNNGDGAGVELLEGLLCVDIDGRQPAAKTGMGMVPAYYGFRSKCSSQLIVVTGRIGMDEPPGLPQHIHHLCLEHWVDGLNTDTSSALGHRKHIHHANCEVIDELSQHQSHDFHGDTCATMP